MRVPASRHEHAGAGPPVRHRDARRHVLRHAHRVLAGRGGGGLHVLLHAERVARYRHAERVRGNGEHHAAVDPAVHPQGRGDRQVAGRSRPLSCVARVDEQGPRRTGHRQRVRVRAVRGDGRFQSRDLLGDRQRRHPRDADARVFAGLCRRDHRRRRYAGHPAAAVDHDDPVRGRGGAVARPAVPRGHRPGRAAGRTVRAVRGLPLPQGASRRGRRVRRSRDGVGLPRRDALLDAREIRDAPARRAFRRAADRRHGRALRRLCDAFGDGRAGCGSRAGTDRGRVRNLAPRQTCRRSSLPRSRSRRC